MTLAGVDGCVGGWIVVEQDGDGLTQHRLFTSFEEIVARAYTAVVIDVPIGLLDAGSRDCDFMARRMLGRRRNSVFPAPIRAMLEAESYEEVCRARERVDGKRCSRQLFAILPKIREVDAGMTPPLQSTIREGHPEVSFAMMNCGRAMHHYKGTAEGRSERVSLLSRDFPEIESKLASLSRRSLAGDLVDAYALLWSARRLAARTNATLPNHAQSDQRGLRAEMVA